MKKFYFDLDGVLCDLHPTYYKLYNNTDFNQKDFTEAVYKHKIFEIAPPTKEFQILMSYVNRLKEANFKVSILTSTASSYEKYYDRSLQIQEQKIQWIKKHCEPFGLKQINFVSNKKYKQEYAKPDSFLLDDDIDNVKQFNKAGGIALLHCSTTIQNTVDFIESLIRGDYGNC